MAEEQAREEGSKENLKFFKKAKASAQGAVQVEEAPEETPEAKEATTEPAEENVPEAAAVVEKPEQPSVPLRVLLAPTLALAIRTLVILAIIVADAFAAYYLVARALAPRLLETRVVNAMRQAEEPPEAAAAETPEATQPPTVGTITPIKDVVVNPSATSGTRYLCTTVALETADPAVAEEIQSREPQIRDLLIEILGRRTVDELSDLKTRETIRSEIETSVNDLLKTGDVTGVYFANFVLQ